MNWHRLFGLILDDLFTGSNFEVEVEKDLSVKQQLLDVVIVRKKEGAFAGKLPDGLENLADHNLVTFKSHQESLDAWALKELVGHYVNYRKQLRSDPKEELLAEANFNLYSLCARFPAKLATQIKMAEIQSGVYECDWGTDRIRIIVLRHLPQEPNNAPLHLFSAVQERIQYGRANYQQHSTATSGLIQQLLTDYNAEGMPMPYTIEDFQREQRQKVLDSLTPEDWAEIAEELPADKLAEMTRKLPADKLAEIAKHLPISERLRGLTKEEIDVFFNKPNDEEGSTN